MPTLFPSRRSQIVAALAACFAVTVSHRAAASDWSAWQPVPDQIQGAVDVRLERVGKTDAPSLCFQFRNRYHQRVTIAYILQGETSAGVAAQSVATLVLEPGEQRLNHETEQSQTVALARITGIAFSKITFDGTPPTPTAEGSRIVSAETRRCEGDLLDAQANVGAAENAKFEAQDLLTRVQRSAERGVQLVMNDGQAVKAIMDQKDVAEARMRVDASKNAEEKAVQAVDLAQTRLAESRKNDAAAFACRQKVAARLAPTRALADAGAWDKVEALYTALLGDATVALPDSDRAILQLNLGLAQMNQKRPADAQNAFAEACRLAPHNAACHSELAGALVATEKWDDAATALDEAIRLTPTDASYRYNLGYVRERQSRWKDAETAYREAVRLDNGNTLYQERLKAMVDAQANPGITKP